VLVYRTVTCELPSDVQRQTYDRKRWAGDVSFSSRFRLPNELAGIEGEFVMTVSPRAVQEAQIRQWIKVPCRGSRLANTWPVQPFILDEVEEKACPVRRH
jgi:hypothetical protein